MALECLHTFVRSIMNLFNNWKANKFHLIRFTLYASSNLKIITKLFGYLIQLSNAFVVFLLLIKIKINRSEDCRSTLFINSNQISMCCNPKIKTLFYEWDIEMYSWHKSKEKKPNHYTIRRMLWRYHHCRISTNEYLNIFANIFSAHATKQK